MTNYNISTEVAIASRAWTACMGRPTTSAALLLCWEPLDTHRQAFCA
jgi:hypothetical protein